MPGKAQPTISTCVKIKRIDHVAICVADVESGAAPFRSFFGLGEGTCEFVASQNTQALLLAVGHSSLELIAPAGNPSLSRFLEKRGPGLHHVAFEVEGIEDALAELRAQGAPLIDAIPRIGARGHKVAFVHPKATGGVLVELVEPMEPTESTETVSTVARPR